MQSIYYISNTLSNVYILRKNGKLTHTFSNKIQRLLAENIVFSRKFRITGHFIVNIL